MIDHEYRQRIEYEKEEKTKTGNNKITKGRRILKHRPRRMKRKERKIIMVRQKKNTNRAANERVMAHTKEEE